MNAGASAGGAVTWLAFTPRDTIMAGDGHARPQCGAAPQAGYPWPSTIAGAASAAIGGEPLDVRGPVLARREPDGAWEPYFPAPADLAVTDDGTMRRLAPAPPSGTVTDLGELALLQLPQELWAPRPPGGWLPARALGAYLSGALTGAGRAIPLAELELAGQPAAAEPRAGTALAADRTARPGYHYQETHLRPADGWAFLAACRLPAGQEVPAAGPVPLGGRGRQADVTVAGGLAWPDAPNRFPGGRVAVYVATPAIWPGGWQIPLPPGARLAAAAAGEPVAVATAAPGNIQATRALRWAVPAGSVYLLEFGSGAEATRWAASWHGEAYGLPAADRLRTAGFGVILTGAWP